MTPVSKRFADNVQYLCQRRHIKVNALRARAKELGVSYAELVEEET